MKTCEEAGGAGVASRRCVEDHPSSICQHCGVCCACEPRTPTRRPDRKTHLIETPADWRAYMKEHFDEPVLVVLSMPRCSPCRALHRALPRLLRVADVACIHLDTSEDSAAGCLRRLKTEGFPCCFLVLGRTIKSTYEGFESAASHRAWLYALS